MPFFSILFCASIFRLLFIVLSRAPPLLFPLLTYPLSVLSVHSTGIADICPDFQILSLAGSPVEDIGIIATDIDRLTGTGRMGRKAGGKFVPETAEKGVVSSYRGRQIK